jgi:hypothetical protein
VLAFSACGGADEAEKDAAIVAAEAAYAKADADGVDFARGPCVAETLSGLDDWVADVAHDPRQPVDDKPANQCRRYRSGQAHHFVELDLRGKVIRAK